MLAAPGSAQPDPLDARPPLPADNIKRQAFAKLQLPNTDRKIFAAIRDGEPVATRDQSRDEFDAWTEYVFHAAAQKTADLDEFGRTDLVSFDLTKPGRPGPEQYRCHLVRFDGKLTAVRRLQPASALREGGVANLYEARLVPADESPIRPVSFVFNELPAGWALAKALDEAKPEEWVAADGWATASGYFFKMMFVPGDQGAARVPVPVLVGKGLTPRVEPPAGFRDPTRVEKKRIDDAIKDDTRMTDATWAEAAAWNRVVLRASRFTATDLDQNALRDVRFADLFTPSRAEFKLSLVRFEGRLISLKREKVDEWLAAAGVTHLYEAWLVPANEPRGNPVCIVFTEPVEGLDPARRVNKWVSFAGYSFKRMRYESAEEDPKNPGKNIDKFAPLLIGRAPVVLGDPELTDNLDWGLFTRVVVGVAVGLVVGGIGLSWWFRRGDRRSREEIKAVRSRNPFDPGAGGTGAGAKFGEDTVSLALNAADTPAPRPTFPGPPS
ncbi:MAG: hypothetical protein K2V38_18485 [Gemmataceae bacterium]|nr:hypothetical protein [Gemmataceae bacterium]